MPHQHPNRRDRLAPLVIWLHRLVARVIGLPR